MSGALRIGVLGVALLAVAAAFDLAPLVVCGLGFLALAAAAPAWVALAGSGASTTRELAARRVLEGEPLAVTITARSGRTGLPGGELRDALLPEPFPLVPGRRGAAVRIEVRFGRRGPRDLPPATLVLRDPLGIASRELRAGRHERVLVLPRIEPVRGVPGAGGEPGGIADLRSLTQSSETELDGLRPLREGTPASRIHWPAVARGAGLLERKLVADGDERPIVVLDARLAGADEADLDAAVRAAASLTVALARGGGCALLLPGERRARTLDSALGGWPALHAELALVRSGRGPNTAAIGARRAAVIWVSPAPLVRIPAVLARGVRGARVLVTPGQAAGVARFTVAGCTGYALSARRRAAA